MTITTSTTTTTKMMTECPAPESVVDDAREDFRFSRQYGIPKHEVITEIGEKYGAAVQAKIVAELEEEEVRRMRVNAAHYTRVDALRAK